MNIFRFFGSGLLLILTVAAQAAPANFEQAKKLARLIHAPDASSFYCDCPIRWQGNKGIPDLTSCDYQVRKNGPRAMRIEWEHVMPAYHFGHQRQCWQTGGRKNCVKSDRLFQTMEADLYNLVPAIGEVNGDRSHYRFGLLPAAPHRHGACPIKVDFKQQVFEPPALVRGDIARIYFYMADKYNLTLSRAQQQLFMAWHKLDPVSPDEQQRNQRVRQYMGHDNPFISGVREWHPGYRTSGYGLVTRQ
ncbi:endonuclease [Arsukibacterium sp.]|uniref:endonuclease n=1 Tax=Arsukibacterium sp. TaxID=1977258 RepID=UPI00299DD3B5|nr:endonuclease [Arsukibacterium sp.]MDX1677906.1 endonuclease [Arsukibacterium sp.]